MINLNFNLKSKKDDNKETLIYAVFRWSGKKVVISTYGIGCPKVKPKNWSEKKQKAKGEKSHNINWVLSRIEIESKKLFIRLSDTGTPSTKQFKTALLEKLTGVVQDKETSPYLVDCFDVYINEMQSRLAISTINGYKAVQKNIKEYQTTKRQRLEFKDLDFDFIQGFIKHQLATKTPNTVVQNIKSIKRVLRYAHSKGINRYDYFTKDWFNYKGTPAATTVYLTRTEIGKLLDLEPQKKAHREVRDIFVIACETGLRHSDWHKLESLDTSKNTQLIHTQKTNKQVAIPITPTVREVIERRKKEPIKVYSRNHVNRLIKELCKDAGITDKVRYHSSKGKSKAVEFKSKYELISTHTARRSFASNAYLANVPLSFIRQITGHTTETQLLTYIKATVPDAVKGMEKIEYFQRPILRAV